MNEDKVLKRIDDAGKKAEALAKQLGIEYSAPNPPDVEESKKKTDFYLYCMENKEICQEFLNSLTVEELAAFKTQNSNDNK